MAFPPPDARLWAACSTSSDMRRASLVALIYAFCAAGAGRPQRIVSLSPDLTEIVYGVGAFDRVVAVSDYDTYPPETAKLPHLGQLHEPEL
jgi:ABC-type hemin transport system substrate-binding protein